MNSALVKAANDEQIVNTALILLLNTVTMFHPSVHADWAIDRKIFHFGDFFEARTDGLLKIAGVEVPLAIVEVKSHLREGNINQIQMQESAQMAAWLYNYPNQGLLTSQFRRLIVSQDNREIYLTFAEYDAAYLQYLKNENTISVSKDAAPPSFMTMHQFGPWNCFDSKFVESVGRIILAFTIQQSKTYTSN
ncbi:hypothetical protein AOQ84DRAFT_425314 [Glonium stellatum]|uniref:Uncharacterized protein n=1 Tax=Glonium stellatum TaxID=574774 RepID=A0A8E2FD73_9PEZI|nr:hypothetical protein AOQ84DRAFT_425314 [Glonium stellatum]